MKPTSIAALVGKMRRRLATPMPPAQVRIPQMSLAMVSAARRPTMMRNQADQYHGMCNWISNFPIYPHRTGT